MVIIKDLKPNTSFEELVLKIVNEQPTREIRNGLHLTEFIGEDASGQIKLNLWNNMAWVVKEGMTIRLINGWTKTFNDELQVSTGQKGRIEILKNA